MVKILIAYFIQHFKKDLKIMPLDQNTPLSEFGYCSLRGLGDMYIKLIRGRGRAPFFKILLISHLL